MKTPPRIDMILIRYDNPTVKLGVHYTDNDTGEQLSALCEPDQIPELFELGNPIELSLADVEMQIPLEWKSPLCTKEWILGRITAYDKITRIKD